MDFLMYSDIVLCKFMFVMICLAYCVHALSILQSIMNEIHALHQLHILHMLLVNLYQMCIAFR